MKKILETIKKRLNEHDKRLHFIAGLVIALVCSPFLGVTAGIAMAIIAGVVKEVCDNYRHGRPELADFIFTAIGGLIGGTTFNIVRLLL